MWPQQGRALKDGRLKFIDGLVIREWVLDILKQDWKFSWSEGLWALDDAEILKFCVFLHYLEWCRILKQQNIRSGKKFEVCKIQPFILSRKRTRAKNRKKVTQNSCGSYCQVRPWDQMVISRPVFFPVTYDLNSVPMACPGHPALASSSS